MTKQPKVATSSGGNRDVIAKERKKRAIDLLRERGKSEITQKEISGILGININTVKTMMDKLCDEGITQVNPVNRGYYRLVDKYLQGGFFDWKFHNGELTIVIPTYCGDDIEDVIFDGGFCKFCFNVYKNTRRATLMVKCSEEPLEISSIYSIYIIFNLLVQKYLNYSPDIKETVICSIEFNKDYFKVRFDGCSCITIDGLLQLFRVYQKKELGCLRVENKIKVPFNLDILMNVLNGCSDSIEVHSELAEIRKERIIMKDYMKQNNRLMQELLKKQDRIINIFKESG